MNKGKVNSFQSDIALHITLNHTLQGRFVLFEDDLIPFEDGVCLHENLAGYLLLQDNIADLGGPPVIHGGDVVVEFGSLDHVGGGMVSPSV